MFVYSNHARLRSVQRNLSPSKIDDVVEYGQVFHKAGGEFYYLRQRDIPQEDDLPEGKKVTDFDRLVGTAVLVSRDGTLITTWRNRRTGLKHIRCKPERSFKQEDET